MLCEVEEEEGITDVFIIQREVGFNGYGNE